MRLVTGLANHGIVDAMCATADSITSCKFEATDPASDEVVLYKILQVCFLLSPSKGDTDRMTGNLIMPVNKTSE